MVSRRHALLSVGALLGGTAGCLGRGGPSDDRIRWRKNVRGTPLLDGGVLYVMDRLTLYALSPADGSTNWRVSYDESEFDRRLCLRSEVADDDSRLYLPGCDGLRALRRSDGERAWFVGDALRSGVGVGGGQVYANADDLLAIDADTGTVVDLERVLV